MHLVAELSNPFITLRTMLKIANKKGAFYELMEYAFAISFLLMRMFATPVMLIWIYEAENVLYSTKCCISLVLFLQLFWCYRIIELICVKVKAHFEA